MDPRGLAVRTVQFHRRQALDPIDVRVTHQCFDAAGRSVASRDPYLFALAQNDASVPSNLNQVFSLSGATLASDSLDAGWRVALQGASGQVVEHWDGRGSHSWTEFDELLRPVAVRENGDGIVEHVLERFTYADADAVTGNLCGQLIRHDDPAGTVHLRELGLGGTALKQTRHFLHDTDGVNWPKDVAARDALLEPGEGATTAYVYAASAELLRQLDALGHLKRFAYTVAGALKTTQLTLAGVGQLEKTLVSDLHYSASGQIEAETAGNGVITSHRYDLANGRLIGLSAHKANGTPLQDLNYRYDAAGNVLSIEDAAQPIRYFNNQRIEPIKTYVYDTLDQLIEATGWEAKTGHGGPALPGMQPLPLDPNQIGNYSQTYHYDAGGNLLKLVHVGAQAHGRTLTRAKYSNRCLPERDGLPPTEAELAAGFDANGNLRELQVGQSLGWDLRNQLSTVCPVVREDGNDDCEKYVYDGGGQRVRKIRVNQTNARTLISEVRYLPGLEIRTHSGTGETLHVINASAGSNSVQVLHWVAQKPDDITNDQLRYSLNDHLQSSAMELDQNADLISQEWYYPFGGTACWAARSATEAKYKTVRYSGKERDATGLYYYGFRYYATWLQRWINPDPAGASDGLNYYRMVRNNPIVFLDPDGLKPTKAEQERNELVYLMIHDRDVNNAYKKEGMYAAERFLLRKYEHKVGLNRAVEALGMVKKIWKEHEKSDGVRVTDSNLNSFEHIYVTNAGSKAVNHSMRTGSEITINHTEVLEEIKTRHGHDVFDRGGKQDKSNIEATARTLSLQDMQGISKRLYNDKETTNKMYFRGQDITGTGLNKFILAMDNKTIIHSKSLLSVTDNQSVAEKFATGANIHVLMYIKGFSASGMHSQYAVGSEGERVFSPNANFKVIGVSPRDSKPNQQAIYLKEVKDYQGPRTPMPY
jgi:insecticidal toxin complex protein TccC